MSDNQKKQWRNQRGAQPVSDLVSKLLNPVFERRAGMTLDLIASWEDIVGEHHAAKSRPEKFIWPRQASDDDPFEPATLIVACDSAHALFFQHDSASVIEHINGYFGFSAVSRLKIEQKPVDNGKDDRASVDLQLSDEKSARLSELLNDVEDPTLKNALEKMGKGVFSERS